MSDKGKAVRLLSSQEAVTNTVAEGKILKQDNQDASSENGTYSVINHILEEYSGTRPMEDLLTLELLRINNQTSNRNG